MGDFAKISGKAFHIFDRPLVLFARDRFESTVLPNTFDTLSPLSVDSTASVPRKMTKSAINIGFRLSLLKAKITIMQNSVIVQLPREPERINHSPAERHMIN